MKGRVVKVVPGGNSYLWIQVNSVHSSSIIECKIFSVTGHIKCLTF